MADKDGEGIRFYGKEIGSFMPDELKSFLSWLDAQPNTKKNNIIEFLSLVRKADNLSLALNLHMNFDGSRGISYDTTKISIKALKKLMLDPI